MKKLLVILGPTATGKTDLALNLAKKFNGEIVSCDSRQVYRGLDIGTGKMPSINGELKIENGEWIFNGIPIHMYDIVDPKKQYNVADYVRDAERVVKNVQRRRKLPIMVGGAGLYLKALLYGLSNLAIPVDKEFRKKLEKLSTKQLQERLKQLSDKKWQSLNHSDRQNPRRLIRAIELEIGKRDLGDFNNLENQGLAKDFDILKIGLTAPREILYKKVDERVVGRINQGMVEEANKLHKKGLSFTRMKQLGLEYGVLANYLEGQINNQEELIKIMQGKIHEYIRRQLTWFKKEKDVNWFDITNQDSSTKVEELIRKWYDNKNAEKNRYFS